MSFKNALNGIENNGNNRNRNKNIKDKNNKKDKNNNKNNNKNIYNNEKTKNNKGKELIIKIFKKNIVLFLITVFVMVISTILGIIGPIIVKQAIDVSIKNSDVNGLLKNVFEYFIITFSMSLLTGFYIYLTEYFGQNFLYEIKTGIFKHIVRLPMKFFDTNPVGLRNLNIDFPGIE